MFASLLFSFLAVIIPSSKTITPWADLEKHADEVMITPYLADDSRNAPTVIVCPGGSYHWLDIKGEGIEVAEWLCDNGINAVLLQYRTAGLGSCIWHYRFLFRGRRHPDMICDVQRTIRYVRENADSLGIDPERVGVMGFSAGGHLAMSSACFSVRHCFRAFPVQAPQSAADCSAVWKRKPQYGIPLFSAFRRFSAAVSQSSWT